MINVIECIKEKMNALSLEEYSEAIQVVDFTFGMKDSTCVSKEIVQDIFNLFPSRDFVEITISNEADAVIQISTISDLDKYDWEIFDGDPVKMKYHVKKNISEQDEVTIYCYDKFCEYIINKELLEIMVIFSELLKDREFINFEVLDSDIYFSTKSISFIGREDHGTIVRDERLEKLKLIRDNSNLRGGYLYSLVPGDFSFQISGIKNKLSDCFAKIETLLSVCYIANDAEIEESKTIKIRISGQRNVNMEMEIRDIVFNKEIVKIYNWIYEGGNCTDKAIIARNILSLHCRYSSIINLDDKTFSSIQSNFNLYQKDNVDRYLDLKNQVGKNVTEIIEKSSELAFSILHGMKKNIIAVFSFLFTVILANIVSEVPLDNIFTRDVTVIFEIIIVFSVFFLSVNIYETNYRINQMVKGFDKLKNNYTDVFDNDELKELMGEENFKNEFVTQIKKQRNMAILFWVSLLLISFVVLELISSDPTVGRIFDLLIRLGEEII
ncbi:MAG: hypothetical protein K6G76_06710 [Lachnospiraceae bacterium]|nr:hypothetical protein [Lachnospiraceae bacterium]